MKQRDLKNLLARGAAAIETPGDLSAQEKKDVIEDLRTAEREVFRTKSFMVTGEGKAAAIALTLVKQSQWFQLEPYPDDEWKFTIKEELELGLDVSQPIELPLEALIISDEHDNPMRIALVANLHSDESVRRLADELDHGLNQITPDYCRTEGDVERLLYEMNDMPEPHFRVEYDPKYAGGSYSDVGSCLYISAVDIDPHDEEAVFEAFTDKTELPHTCIVGWSMDERYTKDGEPLE